MMKKMKNESGKWKVVLLICTSMAFLFPFSSFHLASAQDTSKVRIKPYGFVRNYLNYDSRKTYTVVGGEYNMLPYDELWNEDHTEDLNAVPHTNLQALTSRFGLAVSGPRLLGMKSGAKLEGDFGGFGTNNTVLRLRLAYLKLSDGDDEILVGQDWHPMSGAIMPEVLDMAAGAPFRPHSRTPQVRTTLYWHSVGVTAAFLWQLQYMNNGPLSATDPTSTASIQYAHNALWPETFGAANFKHGPFFVQLGYDVQVLKPRTHAPVGGVTRRVDEHVLSASPTFYAQYAEGPWAVKFRTLLARNTSHLNQLVGYAVTGVNPDGSWNYSPMSASVSYLNVAFGKKYRLNLFLGYMKNLGAGKELYDFGSGDYRIYMKGGEHFTHLNSLYRIAPSLSYNVAAFNLGLEYEYTAATYGDISADGSILDNNNLHQVRNHRLCLLVKYNF